MKQKDKITNPLILRITLIWLLSAVLSGCYSVYQPWIVRKPLRPGEAALITQEASLEWPVRVGVGGPARNDFLTHDLDVTHLFQEVRPFDKKDYKPDLIVETLETANQTDPIPFFTIITLGFFPTIWRDQFGHRFRIRNAVTGEQTEIQFPVHTINVMGWLAAPLRLFPGWSGESDDPRESGLYSERFKAALLIKKGEIDKIVISHPDRAAPMSGSQIKPQQ